MKITVIGTGNMGSGFAKQLSSAGHSVRITGRDFEKAKTLADQYPNVTAYTASEALGDSDLVVVATGFGDAVSALQSLGDLTGKVIIDITNPLERRLHVLDHWPCDQRFRRNCQSSATSSRRQGIQHTVCSSAR